MLMAVAATPLAAPDEARQLWDGSF